MCLSRKSWVVCVGCALCVIMCVVSCSIVCVISGGIIGGICGAYAECEDRECNGVAWRVQLGRPSCECGVVDVCMTVVCGGNLRVHGCVSSWGGVAVGAAYMGDCVCICVCYGLLCVTRKSRWRGLVKGFIGCLCRGEWGWESCV